MTLERDENGDWPIWEVSHEDEVWGLKALLIGFAVLCAFSFGPDILAML